MLNNRQLIVIVLFVLIFILAGWGGPIMAAQYAPDGTYVDPVDLRVENVSSGDQYQRVCFTAQVKDGTRVTVDRQLLYIPDGVERFVGQWRDETYIREGNHTTEYTFTLPENLKPGTYRYNVFIEFEVGSTNVKRATMIKSNPFVVHNSSSDATNETFRC